MSDAERCRNHASKKPSSVWDEEIIVNTVVMWSSAIFAGWLWGMAAYFSGFFWIPTFTISLYCAYVAIGYLGFKLSNGKIAFPTVTPRFAAVFAIAFVLGAARVDAFYNIFYYAGRIINPFETSFVFIVSSCLSLEEGGYGYRVLELVNSCISILAPLFFVCLGAALQKWKCKQEKCSIDQQGTAAKAIPILENNLIALSLHAVLNVIFIIGASFLYWDTLVNVSRVAVFSLAYVLLAGKLFRANEKHPALSVVAPSVLIVLCLAAGILTAYAASWSIESFDALSAISRFYFFTFDISFSTWQASSLFWKVIIPIGAVVTPSALMLLGFSLKKWRLNRKEANSF